MLSFLSFFRTSSVAHLRRSSPEPALEFVDEVVDTERLELGVIDDRLSGLELVDDEPVALAGPSPRLPLSW
ncbi:MAG TPA: hypothetical protein VFW73_03975 [Lacipirellulaceae bacterium]|nr:hypothetical protein [Lacipirellulaceae bacterium]